MIFSKTDQIFYKPGKLAVRSALFPVYPSPIKNYSENEGILDLLIGLGVIEPPHRRIASGFVMIDICNMNRSKLEEYSYGADT